MATFTPLDQTMMMVAKSFAAMASCTHRNVGAVVVSPDGRIYGHGYAKAPNGHKLCTDGGCPRGQLPAGMGKPDYSDCITVHAEINAIGMAGYSLCEEGTMYVNSYPCAMCWRVAEESGLARVVWSHDGDYRLQEQQFL